MGNACCADDTERKTFDAAINKARDLDPSVTTTSLIKFPTTSFPTKSNIVQQLSSLAGTFTAKKPLRISPGTPSQPRALNKQGLVYVGQWRHGIPHGKGELFYPNGSYYIGYFNNGNADGQGRFISPQGWIYEGELQNQQAQGKGVLYHKGLKYKFEGMWSGDLPNGYGKEQWQSKNISYEGQFLNGKKHGEGKYITPDFQYQGIFSNDKFDSYGQLSYRNGEKYEGNFEKGLKQGKGTYSWTDGSYYEGSYKNDLKHGQGRYKSHDDNYWEGEWVNGMRQGLGSLKANNKKYVSKWSNNTVIQSQNNNNNNKNQIDSKLSAGTFRA